MTEPSRAEAIREAYRLFHDTFKHLTTLSTGAILILATFLDKLVRSPHWHFLIPISVLGFLASVMTSVPVLFSYATLSSQNPDDVEIIKKWATRSVIASVGGFIVGIVALAVFAARNL
jgi:hypothetical protein